MTKGPKTPKKRAGRPALSSEGSEQVAVRYPQWMLDAVAQIIDERGGPGVVDRVAVIREATAKGLAVMGYTNDASRPGKGAR